MSLRAKVRWISFGTALVLCLVATVVASYQGAARYETRIDSETARALGATVDAVHELDLSLKKSACAVTPGMENAICTEIYSNAQQVESSLAVLPVESDSLEQIARHVAVVGDYAAMLSRANALGERFSDDDLRQLAQFSDTTAQLYDALSELQRQVAAGELTSERFRRITDSLDNLEDAAASTAGTMAAQMQSLAEQFPEVPALVYDGAYTDRSGETPKALDGLPEVTEKQARAAAAAWLACDADSLSDESPIEGKVPCYCFAREDQDRTATVAVTRQGGQVLWMTCDGTQGEATITPETAAETAAAYVASHGLTDMRPVQSTVSGGEAVIKLVAVENDGVICYPDAVSVTVSLDSGAVSGYSAREYLMRHTERDLNALGGDTARTDAAIPTFLSVQAVQPVVLSGIGLDERLCYAYDCADDTGAQYRIYVNAVTGEQEKIVLPDELAAERALLA